MKIYTLKEIVTPRLILRPVKHGDEFQINKLVNNSIENLKKWNTWTKNTSFDATKRFVEKSVLAWKEKALDDLPMSAIYKESGNIIGVCGYNDNTLPQDGIYEIGYWLDVDYQGMGLATEYANALTRVALDILSAKKAVIVAEEGNTKSMAVAKRLGFSYAGEKKRNLSNDVLLKEELVKHVFILTETSELPALDLEVDWNN
ncbi:MAG: GNAT family protein [Rickettsiaceae bacterium]|nr:GNAT family protein [Rickettsiaceae bacterium]